jgi:hypothetical protein
MSLVRYPSREAFSRMVADPEDQQVTHLRTAALREAVLQPAQPWLARRPVKIVCRTCPAGGWQGCEAEV